MELVTMKEAADIVGVSVFTIIRLRRKHVFKTVLEVKGKARAGRYYLFDKKEAYDLHDTYRAWREVMNPPERNHYTSGANKRRLFFRVFYIFYNERS